MAIQAEDEEILSKFRDETTRNEAFNLIAEKVSAKNILACAPHGY
jgi:hypothetical protein